MKQQLEEFFGCTVEINKYEGKLGLPIYMTMRRISIVELYGTFFALVDISKENELSVSAMKKQKKKYEDTIQYPIAYIVSLDSLLARNTMIKNDIAFIDLPRNIFLPFLGIVLQDAYKKQLIKTDRMMPATQMVFLKLFYMEDNESALKSEIASKLNLTKTSLTRATAQLKAMNLIVEKKSGIEISIMRNCNRKEYYDRARKYLINPVQKIITVKIEEVDLSGFISGESALSNITELNPPVIPEIAIYKGEELVDQLQVVDARFEEHSSCVKLQLWKYNPEHFAKNGIVDPVSLVCSLIGNEDERIDMCMDKILESL